MSIRNFLTSDFLRYKAIKCFSMECLNMIVDTIDADSLDIDNLIVNTDLSGAFNVNVVKTLLDGSVNSVLLNDVVSGIEINRMLADDNTSIQFINSPSALILKNENLVTPSFAQIQIDPTEVLLTSNFLGITNTITVGSIIEIGGPSSVVRIPKLSDGLVLANPSGTLSVQGYSNAALNLSTIAGNRIPSTYTVNYQVVRFQNIVWISGKIIDFVVVAGAGSPVMDLNLPIPPSSPFASDVVNGACSTLHDSTISLFGIPPYVQANVGSNTVRMTFVGLGNGTWRIKFQFTYLI